jgi:hypothetical protein
MTEPLVLPTPSFPGTIRATWTDPRGTQWQLSDDGEDSSWFTTFGISGWGARPYEIVVDPLPRGGDTVRFIRANSARITWPLYISGATNVEFRDNYRALKRAFVSTAHLQQPGQLSVAYADGTARQIDCFYEDGFGGEPGENWVFAKPVLTLFAPDGYWRDVMPVTLVRTAVTGNPFFDPFPTISSSQVLGASTLTNAGDVEAWPTWTVTGPMTELTAENLTTGFAFTLTTTLLVDEQLTITTGQPSVIGPTGTNLVGSLNWPDAYLWPLVAGDNEVQFTVGGSGDGTKIEMTFYPRYEGA